MTRLCTRTVEVDGAIAAYSGDYDFYLRERDIRMEQLVASWRRQRAMLAILLSSPLNFLILDEPTNHLDIALVDRGIDVPH